MVDEKQQQEKDEKRKASAFDYIWRIFWASTSLFCAVMLPYAILLILQDASELEANAAPATGVVINKHCKTMTGHAGAQKCRTEVRFAAADGKQYTFIEPTNQNATIGQKVKVKYMRNQPSNAKIDSAATERSETLYYVVLGGLALVFTVLAVWNIRSIYRMATGKWVPGD